jgi:hypothetical protein
VHHSEDIAYLMQVVGPYDDLAYPETPSHTSWTLDDGHMILDIVVMAILVIIWEGCSQAGQSTLEHIRV